MESYYLFTAEQFNIIILLGAALVLLLVNVFRHNILIVLGSIFVDVALAHADGAPLFVLYAGYLFAAAELVGFLGWVFFGKDRHKNRRRFVG